MIDDDGDDQELFCQIATSIDHSIKCVSPSDGKEAFRLLLKEKAILPELIFLDLNMPGMSGFEFLKQIKNHNSLNHIPVIIYTTSAAAKDKEESVKLGAASFITKPSDLSELRQKLEIVLR